MKAQQQSPTADSSDDESSEGDASEDECADEGDVYIVEAFLDQRTSNTADPPANLTNARARAAVHLRDRDLN